MSGDGQEPCIRLLMHRLMPTSLACTVITTFLPLCWQIAHDSDRRGLRALMNTQQRQPRCPRPRQWQIHASQSSASGKLR